MNCERIVMVQEVGRKVDWMGKLRSHCKTSETSRTTYERGLDQISAVQAVIKKIGLGPVLVAVLTKP